MFLKATFSNTSSLCSSLNVGDQVSHPYKWTFRIMHLCLNLLNESTCKKYVLLYIVNYENLSMAFATINRVTLPE
jgi:hypothetical protein